MKILYLTRDVLLGANKKKSITDIAQDDFRHYTRIELAERVIFTDIDGKTKILKDKFPNVGTAEILLMNSRTQLGELIDKAWEMGGFSVGENEFNTYSWVLDARETIAEIDEYFSKK